MVVFFQCEMNVYELMQKETLFFDPYIEYTSDGEKQLYPIPVIIDNYHSADGSQPNAAEDRSNWVAVRRFFLVDTVFFPGPERR